MRHRFAWSALAFVLFASGTARAANPAWSTSAVDNAGNAGWSSSLAFDPLDGNPSIAFIELSKNQLKFSDWNGARWVTENVAIGGGPDLGYDLAGRPCMSLIYGSKADIRLARREAGKWTFQYVDKGIFGRATALAFDAAGHPAIAYEFPNRKQTQLKLARWNGVSWSAQVVDIVSGARWLSLAFDAQGRPAIAYSFDADGDARVDTLRFASWDGSKWSFEVVDTTTGGGGISSIALSRDPVSGELAVAYARGEAPKGPRFARRTAAGWSVESIEVVNYVFDTSLAFDASGRAYVVYVDAKDPADDIKLAWRDSGGWLIEVVDTAYADGSPTSLAIGPGGVPAMSYRASSVNTLFYAIRSAVP